MEGFAKILLLLLRCLGQQAIPIFQERFHAMSLAFIHRHKTAPGAIAPGMRLREALALAALLLIERTPEGPVLRRYTSTQEAVDLFLEELRRIEAGPEGGVY